MERTLRRLGWLGLAAIIVVALGGPAIAQQFVGQRVPLRPVAHDDHPAPIPDRAPSSPTTEISAPANPAATAAPAKEQDPFNLDLESLGKVEVKAASPKPSGPSTVLDRSELDLTDANSTGALLEKAGNIATRRTSALNLDPIVRGFNSQQINATANGMNQLKTRIDIDSLFSQIDPGVVQDLTILDGPYTSLYGPGFAFLTAELFAAPRYRHGPEGHGSTIFNYGTNANSIYFRQNVWGGSQDWGAYASYGWRSGGDFRTGGGFDVPSSFEKQDGFLSASCDLPGCGRVEVNYLRTDIGDLELPGVVYDLNRSLNDQLGLRWVLQEDPKSPTQFVAQYWYHNTTFAADASRPSKQQSFFRDFITLSGVGGGEDLATLTGDGRSRSMGARFLSTLGERHGPQLTFGADWRRNEQRYVELDFDSNGGLAWAGNAFGIPQSQQDDLGVFTHFCLPICEYLKLTTGGRLDGVKSTLDQGDAVVTQYGNPADLYYLPGMKEPWQTLGMAYAVAEFQATKEWTLTAGAAFAMRAPTLAELYSDEPYVPMVRFGNSYIDGFSELEPEENLQFDLSANYRGERFRTTARGFFSNIRNYILPIPAQVFPAPPAGTGSAILGRRFDFFAIRDDLTQGNPNADQSQVGYHYANIDWATIWGADLQGEYELHKWCIVGSLVSYVQGDNRAPQRFVQDAVIPSGGYFESLPGSDPLPGIYPLHGAVWIRFLEPEKGWWSLEFRARWAAEQHRVARTLAEVPTPGFVVFGLRGEVKPNDHLKFTLAIENLFDANYTQHGSLAVNGPTGRPIFVPEPGFGAFLGMEINY